jgi:hypothetical protein
VGFVRDATQDCTAAPASATTSTASFPGGACEKGRLIVAVAQVPAFVANVSVKGGARFTVAKSQDHGSAGCLIGAVFISAGTETGVTFTHSSAAGQMRVFGFQYKTPLSPDRCRHRHLHHRGERVVGADDRGRERRRPRRAPDRRGVAARHRRQPDELERDDHRQQRQRPVRVRADPAARACSPRRKRSGGPAASSASGSCSPSRPPLSACSAPGSRRKSRTRL